MYMFLKHTSVNISEHSSTVFSQCRVHTIDGYSQGPASSRQMATFDLVKYWPSQKTLHTCSSPLALSHYTTISGPKSPPDLMSAGATMMNYLHNFVLGRTWGTYPCNSKLHQRKGVCTNSIGILRSWKAGSWRPILLTSTMLCVTATWRKA